MTGDTLPERAHQQREVALNTLATLNADPNLRVLAIATTDLKGMPVEVVLLDGAGRSLVSARVRPAAAYPIHPQAQALHGLGEEDVRHALELVEVLPDLHAHIPDPGAVVVFSDYTAERLQAEVVRANSQAYREHGTLMTHALPGAREWSSLQRLLMPISGAWNHTRGQYGYVSRADALHDIDVPRDLAPAGTTLGNAQRDLALIRWHATAPRTGIVDDSPKVEEGTCCDCGAPFDFCECPRENG